MRALLTLSVSACCACEHTWPAGTELHTESEVESRAAVWHDQVKLGIRTWADDLGTDCPFPYVLLDTPSETSHAIRLVTEASYDGPEHSSGYWDDDGAIYVMDKPNKPNATYIIYTAMHELGHAMSGGWHSEDPDDLMYWKGSGQVSDNDVRRMRSALDCSEK